MKFVKNITNSLYLSQIRTAVTVTAKKVIQNSSLMRFLQPKDILLSARIKVVGEVYMINSYSYYAMKKPIKNSSSSKKIRKSVRVKQRGFAQTPNVKILSSKLPQGILLRFSAVIANKIFAFNA